MDLTQLEYFQKLAELSSVTKAAAELHISQPSLSQSLSKLEAELGVELFDRNKKKIMLNTYGELYLGKVTPILSMLSEAQQELLILKQTIDSPLTIKVWRSSSICSKIIAAFLDRYPYVNLKVIQEDYSDLIPKHTGEDYDIALVNGTPDTMPPYPSKVIFKENILVAVNKKHPHANDTEINLSDLKNDNFILLPPERPFSQLIIRACRQAGFTPKVVIENDSAATLQRMVKLNLGVGFVAETSWELAESDEVKLLKISSPICVRAVSVSSPKTKEPSYVCQLFIKFAENYLTSLHNSITREQHHQAI